MNLPYPELTNLLPRASVRALRRGYFVRLISVILVLGTTLLIIHGILLMPAYLYAHSQVQIEQTELNRQETSATSHEEKTIAQQIASVQSDISYLARLSKIPTASGAIRAILSVPHRGIVLSGFTFTASTSATEEARMTVSGTARTRDALRTYVDELGRLSYVTKADLPISAYAKDSDIPFTITLTGSFLP